MADRGSGDILRPSIIDRLSGRFGGSRDGQFQPIGVRELKQAVARDLEWLLNTRVWLPQTPEELEDLVEGRESLLCYGIPDLSVFSWASPADCQRIAALVEQTIRSFEPRLLPRCEPHLCFVIQRPRPGHPIPWPGGQCHRLKRR